MKQILCFSLSLLCMHAMSQSTNPQVVSTSGSSFNNGTSQLDWTLGEPVTSTYNIGGNMLTQGFHQPNLLITSVDNPETVYSLNVFPNPAIDYVQLQFRNLTEDVTVELFAADGKLLESKQVTGISDLQINMANYRPGTYMLSVKSKQSKIKTYKIAKLH